MTAGLASAARSPAGAWSRLAARVHRPVDASPLVAFRVLYGGLVVLECAGALATGWVRDAYVHPAFHFRYVGFEWVPALAGPIAYVVFAALAVLGVAIAVGFHYRAAAALFFAGWSWAFLSEAAFYQNHYYLLVLVAGLMACAPAHRAASWDVRRGAVEASGVAPAWSIGSLKLLLSLVYFFAGVAKLDRDWLALEPIRHWLEARSDLPLVGPIYASERTAWLFAWGGLVFDLAIGPLLWWRRTRFVAVVLACLFHLVNAVTFVIGIFPLFAVALTSLFLPPQWFRRVLGTRVPPASPGPSAAPAPRGLRRSVGSIALALFFAVQVALPLRHLAIPGDVAWTEEGHRFSWRMKLREKAGTVRFEVVDRSTGERMRVRADRYLHDRQRAKVATHPDLLWQFARHLGRVHGTDRGRSVAVHATAWVRLNHRPPQLLVDPAVDLTRVEYALLGGNDWIRPFARDPIPPVAGDDA